MGSPMTRDAVLLTAYGGPVRLDQVEAYYTDIRHGAPPPPELLRELLRRYEAIGGGSPLSAIVERQRACLADALAARGWPVAVYAGMKHIAPFIGDVVDRMATDGIERAVGIALAPHASAVTSGTYRRAVEDRLAGLPRTLTFRFIESWHAEPRFISALAAATTDALLRFPDPRRPHVVFTAHSLPERVVDAGDPYPGEVARTAALVAETLDLETFEVAYQSAGRTADAWLGPDLLGRIRRLGEAGCREVVVCPVGFVAEHLEVLYDIDIEAQAVAADSGVRLERVRALNDDPVFIAGLADLAEGAFSSEAA